MRPGGSGSDDSDGHISAREFVRSDHFKIDGVLTNVFDAEVEVYCARCGGILPYTSERWEPVGHLRWRHANPDKCIANLKAEGDCTGKKP